MEITSAKDIYQIDDVVICANNSAYQIEGIVKGKKNTYKGRKIAEEEFEQLEQLSKFPISDSDIFDLQILLETKTSEEFIEAIGLKNEKRDYNY